MNMDIILYIILGQITGTPIRVFATWNSPGTRFGVLRPGIRIRSQFGLLRPGIRIPGRKTYLKAAICLILASSTPPTPPHTFKFGLLRPGIRIPGRKTKFKAAICLILASNTPPPPPHAGGWGMGWGVLGYLRQGLSKLLP